MSNNFKKLTLQHAYLELEKEEILDICKKMEPKIKKYMKDNYPEHYDSFFKTNEPKGISDPEDENNNDISNQKTKSANKNKDLKILYRKIAEKTHPDKTGDNSKADIFSAATTAYDSEDIAKILEIAGGLNIEVPNLSPESILLLNNNIKKVSDLIEVKKQSAAWHWYESGDDDLKKEALIKIILKHKGIIV